MSSAVTKIETVLIALVLIAIVVSPLVLYSTGLIGVPSKVEELSGTTEGLSSAVTELTAAEREIADALEDLGVDIAAIEERLKAVEEAITPPPLPKGELKFWNYWDGTNALAIEALISEFNEEYSPDIRVINVPITWGELLPKLMAAAAGGEVPEVAIGDLIWMPKLAGTGMLVPLNDYVKEIDYFDFYPEMRKIGRYDDQIYSLPVSANNLQLFYNKDIFRAAGLDPEKPPTTWDELVDTAIATTDPVEGIWGMELYTGTGEGLTWQFQVYLWQAGGEFLTADLSKAAFNSPEGKRALQFWVDLIQTHQVSPLAPWGLFGQGKAAMVMDGTWMVGGWRPGGWAPAPFDWGTALMPMPSGGGPATNMGGEQIFIFETTPEKEAAAWEFVKWLTSKRIQIKWDMLTSFMPVRDSVATDEVYLTWATTTEPRLQPFIEGAQYARARPMVTQYPEISDAFSEEIQKALYGTVTVDEALANAEARVNVILAG
ncbi:MAG: ABC transporter substrate-binding protein [Candidatus Heimdallarchaeota archaeon]